MLLRLARKNICFSSDLSTDSGVVDFEDMSDNAVEWYWNFGDGNTSTEQNPTHTYTISGEYVATLEVKNANGCDAYASAVINVTNPLSTNVIPNEDLGIAIYPNPAQHQITIEINDYNLSDVEYTIYDIVGKAYQGGKLQSKQTSLSIDDLASGVYFVDFQADGARQIIKLVKQ